jgi:hypothetical protein
MAGRLDVWLYASTIGIPCTGWLTSHFLHGGTYGHPPSSPTQMKVCIVPKTVETGDDSSCIIWEILITHAISFAMLLEREMDGVVDSSPHM